VVGELRCRAGRESKGVAGRTVRVRQADDTVRRYHLSLFSCRDLNYFDYTSMIAFFHGGGSI